MLFPVIQRRYTMGWWVVVSRIVRYIVYYMSSVEFVTSEATSGICQGHRSLVASLIAYITSSVSQYHRSSATIASITDHQ